MFKSLFTPDLEMFAGLVIGIWVIPMLLKIVHDAR